MQLRFTPQNVAYLLSSISLGTTVSNTQEKLETLVMQKFVQKAAVGPHTCTLGDKLQQHVAATDHSMCTGQATSCSNKVRWHVAATNPFVCTGEFLWKSLSPKQNFVAATSGKKSNHTICATCWSNKILLQRQRFSQKFSSTNEAICHCDVPLQSVAATSCSTCTHRVFCSHDLLLQLVI